MAALLLLLAAPPALQLAARPSAALSWRPAPLSPQFSRVAVSPPTMQAGDGAFEKSRKTSKAATIARPKPKPKSKRKEDVDKEPMWRVLLHNDDVHTWDYVIFAIVSVVKTITRKKAHRITTQVHTMGTATVTVSWKQQAKQYCLKLQQFGLTSSIAPDPSA
ncbi:hypothetical protein AB1Y20_012421 [Prymnesium parvum]|uniref:Adaptor protein ClpS core domain-containing protein n=1 Tax=Prymnesium parvum TaxID=97485 RepID=A0AB34IHT8_PRYPA|mmetsp:Transcript_21767/g.32400  ORF Transcript_21767/g.32400 Transcript_21767/m.32400 type:complete len:162 (+) Transcript_21767:43-528(+)